ncbi:Obg family GTPase CgtA [Candidatus Omnitrophota bacterium]
MIDSAKIYVKAGDGGKGCTSFKGKKFTRSRHPDGGNGGKGADVIIRTRKNVQTLERFRFQRHFKADKGACGQANKKRGANARPCIIDVPPGTVVCDLEKNLLLRDLDESEQQIVVANGGLGGRGNTRTEEALPGAPGEARNLLLELKLVADIAIVGYPNTGKSTFLTKVSSARPKIASYPFTTTSPFLAVVNFSDFQAPQALTVLELPGLSLGAHQGKGLGLDFLRHAERARILLHLVDLAVVAGRDPYTDYLNVNQELRAYNPALLARPQIIAANKLDLPGAKDNLEKFISKVGPQQVYPISASTGAGIAQLLKECRGYFNEKDITS